MHTIIANFIFLSFPFSRYVFFILLNGLPITDIQHSHNQHSELLETFKRVSLQLKWR